MFDASQNFVPYWHQGVTIIPGEPIPVSTDPLQNVVHTTLIELSPGFIPEEDLANIVFDGTIPPIAALEKFHKHSNREKRVHVKP